jgi:hypothetical protein
VVVVAVVPQVKEAARVAAAQVQEIQVYKRHREQMVLAVEQVAVLLMAV